MRVLLIHRYFWPDAPPYASMLRTIGARLSAEGHDVTVLSAQPSYVAAMAEQRRPRQEVLDGMCVRRMPLLPERRQQTARRLINTLLFVAQVGWHVAARRDDLVMFSTMPPVVLGVVVRVALALTGRAGRYVYHCQDIHPEAAVAGGLLRAGRCYRLLQRIDTTTCRRAAAVVVLSDDMRATMLQRGVDQARIDVRNNFALVDPDTAVAPQPDLVPPRQPGAYVVAFAGNLGRFQQLDTLLDAAWLLRDDPDVQWWFIGDGALRDHLRQRTGALVGDTVHFVGYQPPAVAFGMLARADLAVVSLGPGMHRVAFPSKTMTALMAGCRLLVVADTDSDLARMVRDGDLGSAVPAGDAAAVARAIRHERSLPGPAGRAHQRTSAQERFSADVVCSAWTQMFTRISREAAA